MKPVFHPLVALVQGIALVLILVVAWCYLKYLERKDQRDEGTNDEK